MTYDQLLSLIDRLESSSIDYLSYQSDHHQVVLSKSPLNHAKSSHIDQNSPAHDGLTANKGEGSHPNVDQSPLNLTGQSPANDPGMESPSSIAAGQQSQGKPVKSPIVGVVYLQPEPTAGPFVQVGDKVEKGQTLCLIEAMKLMNEIQAPVSGVIQAIHVDNEALVAYDQVLFEIL
ncbi:TPA: acetyl-CoA carboxylase biotin carboxyl carrier protein subunit [Streptococcus suis]